MLWYFLKEALLRTISEDYLSERSYLSLNTILIKEDVAPRDTPKVERLTSSSTLHRPVGMAPEKLHFNNRIKTTNGIYLFKGESFKGSNQSLPFAWKFAEAIRYLWSDSQGWSSKSASNLELEMGIRVLIC